MAGPQHQMHSRMALRIVTAIIGGYAAASGIAALSARLAPFSRAEATTWAMILSFLLYAVLMLWAFHEPRVSRVAGVVWGMALVTGGAVWMLGVPA